MPYKHRKADEKVRAKEKNNIFRIVYNMSNASYKIVKEAGSFSE